MFEQLHLPGMAADTFVYFGARRGFIKIGFTGDPHRRAKELRLTLLRVLRGGRLEERALHRRFADDRVDREWFFESPDIRRFIDQTDDQAA